MTVTLKNNPYNNPYQEYGQAYDILHIALWQGETLPDNYIWYGLGQEAQRSEYPELYQAVEKYGWLVSEEEWQAGHYGKFSSGDGNTTFRFPLIRDGDVLSFTNGTTIESGMKIEPELPNATGTVSSYVGYTTSGSNKALYSSIGGNTGVQGGAGVCTSNSINIDLSRASSIYKNNGTVKQSAIASRLIVKYR